ncbi:MAG: hypothetical protein EPO52_07075 [Herbiconiux sp.]|uniref:hypothetical protein n=1 Tax=Herbiconiux sp. TaxID=1871186 RepID=UPI0011F8CA72|nr:hypothetical protein [Herbiconiux sp.]TAJ47945.1 MAG: hypothetical protein EPO52_07075 [Herbiconiux sp.]
MTSLSPFSLRLGTSSFGGYHAEGWHPTLAVQLVGPAPAGAWLEWTVARPDGGLWFTRRAPIAELGAGETADIDLRPEQDSGDLDVEGSIGFTLRLVSELEGVDDLLHDASVRVVALPGAHRFAVDPERMPPWGFVALDAVDEPDAPRLCATVVVAGEAEAWEFEAHLFHDGRRIAQADSPDTRYAFTANDGTVVGRELALRFDAVRGWNDLQASGWGAGWHLLDAHDGHYEVKLLREGAVVQVIAFGVVRGRVVATGLAASDLEMAEVYARRSAVEAGPGPEPEPQQAPEPASEAGGAVDVVSLRAFFDRAERLLLTWETDLLEAAPPFELAQVLAAEAVLAERPGYAVLRDAASAIPDGHPVELAGEPTTIGGLRRRVEALFAAAEARITGAEEGADEVLAPYRALLSGDKLRVFDEHPADAFLYTTTDRRVIETPEEIAEAEFWYFEGPLDLPSTATVDGVRIDVTVQGWRVLGWQFAPDHSIVDQFETQGHGAGAPRSAYRHTP